MPEAAVLIVGGGPAGAACAIVCAEAGLPTILVEREAAPRDKPGEALHPGVAPLLGQLGVPETDLLAVTGARFAGVRSAWGGAERLESFGEDEAGPWLGYQVRRAAFESLLLDRARTAGAEVRSGQPAGDPTISDGRMLGAGDITAALTVDATGPARWLSRRLDLASVERSPRLIARYGYARGSAPGFDATPLIDGDGDGWTWIARVDDGLYQWVRLDFDGRVRPRDWTPPPLAGLDPARPTQGAEVAWRRAARLAGPGWMLVGDVAASLDPASSHGVLKALMSGVAAAQSIVAVLARGAPEAEAGRAYQGWLTGWFDADVKRLAESYAALGAEGFG